MRKNTAATASALLGPVQRIEKIQNKQATYLPQRTQNVALNGQVHIPVSGLQVECRHFAAVFALFQGTKRELTDSFSTEAGIGAFFSDGKLEGVEEQYYSRIQHASQACKHLFSGEQLGQYLEAVAKAVQRQEPTPGAQKKQANCLLLTEDHAMALHVEFKTKSGVGYFAVKLYDPNLTNNYTRVESSTAQGLRKLTFETMMPCPHLASLYLNGNAKLSMVAVCLDAQLEPQMSRPTVCESPVEMHNILSRGLYTQLALFLKHIFCDSNNLSDDAKAERLAAKTQTAHLGSLWPCNRGTRKRLCASPKPYWTGTRRKKP
ncbi:MAG: ShET2/EspL2 family type III secretion system effector toxin [Limnobacter sp.]|nr:ShET2/EspL2 family type III secretion system effector toxin [Limnobacter sp.]